MSKLSQGNPKLGPAQFSIYGSRAGNKASRSETPGLKRHPGSVSSHKAKNSSLPLAQKCTILSFESVYVPATHSLKNTCQPTLSLFAPQHPVETGNVQNGSKALCQGQTANVRYDSYQ